MIPIRPAAMYYKEIERRGRLVLVYRRSTCLEDRDVTTCFCYYRNIVRIKTSSSGSHFLFVSFPLTQIRSRVMESVLMKLSGSQRLGDVAALWSEAWDLSPCVFN